MEDNSNNLFSSQNEPKPLFGGNTPQHTPKPLFGETQETAKPLFGTKENPVVSTLPDVQEVSSVPPAIPQPEKETSFIPVENAPQPGEPIQIETPLKQNTVNEFGMDAVPAPREPGFSESPAAETSYVPSGKVSIPKQTLSFTIPTENATIGELMRNARMSFGLDMEQIFRDSRIQVKYLQAIENDEFQKLPPGSFPRAYIRKLISIYGLDKESAEIVYRKLEEKSTPEEITTEIIQSVNDTKRINREEDKRVRKIFYIAVCVISLLFLGLCAGIVTLIFHAGKTKNITAEASPADKTKLQFTNADLEKLSAPQIPSISELKIPAPMPKK